MSNRSLATAPSPAKPALQPAVNSVLLRDGVTELSWQPDIQDATGHDGAPWNASRGFSSMPPPAEERKNGWKSGTDLTSTGVHARTTTIRDDDTGRALLTWWLIHELAPLLGLDPDKIEIRANREAESRVNARGANGVMEGGTIYLHPRRYQPNTREGRYLLAHEATHVAQRGLTGKSDTCAAEHEAGRIGEAFAGYQRVTRPTRPLLALAIAADVGAPTEQKPVPLSESVRTSRSREIAAIKSLLSGLWVSDGDVFNILQILESVSFPVAKAIIQALEKKERYWLADNINPPHVYTHRTMVLACYRALDGDQFDAVDLKVFRALPVVGLTTEEIDAAFYTLQHLRDGARQELLRSENGPAIARIITAPRPSAEESKRLQEESEKAAKDEAALAEERKAILQHANDEGAKSLVEQVKALLSSRREGETDHNPTGYDAVQALERLGQARNERTRFLYVAEQLEQSGFVDILLQLLPSNSYFEPKDHTEVLIQLVQSRLPWKNAKLIEDLLSYGLFDWAIRDYEALFAYQLIKLLPLSDQYRFRQRDAGKWYLRLLENLPDDPVTKKLYPGLEIRKAESREEIDRLKAEGIAVDEKELLFNASQVYEKKLQEQGTANTLQALVAAFHEAQKGGAQEAKELFRRLVALGGSSLEPAKESPGDQILREAVIHELDRWGYIRTLFEEIPDSFLFAEENRISTVKIMLARDPARVQAHARELVSRGFTDWMVKDGEAYLAYMCIKALPQDERNLFISYHAEEWSRIQGEMSESMRQSRDLNLYIGDAAGTDRASVLGQLAAADTWTDDNASVIDGLVRMAIAMTEHRFAFDRSEEFQAKEKPKLLPLVEKYRLWNPATGRSKYEPEVLKGTKWYEEGVFASLKSLWSGLVLLWNLDILFVDGKVGAKVDLNDVQDFRGGDLAGVKLGDPKKRGARESLGHPDANKITLLLGTDGKSAEVHLPELVIDSANVQLASTTLQTGTITLKGLHLNAAYDTDHMLQPTEAHVELASVEANDLLLVKSSSMITVGRLIIQALRMAAGTIDTVTRVSPGERKGLSVPFPLLVIPLLALFVLLGLPVFIYRKIADLLSQGLESNTGEHFAADVVQRTKAIKFSFSSLDVDGLNTSGGQHVRHVGVRDFALRIGLNKPTRLRAEKFSIEQRLAALEGKPEATEVVAKLQQRKSEIDAELVTVKAQEVEYVQIQRRILQGGLKPDEQGKLQKRLDELNFDDKGGVFFDIGSLEASGLSGTITSKDKEPIHLSNIHGEGGGSALTQFVGMPTVTNKELSRRSAAGERPEAPLSEGQEGKFSIELGDVHTGELTVGGGIRSVAEIDKKLEELKPLKSVPEIVPLYESLQLLRQKAERYELMVCHGVSALKRPELAEFRELRRVLTDQATLVIQSIDLTRATLDVDVASGRVDFGVQAARIAGVQLPQKGIEIDEVIARGLGVGALPAGGLLNWQDWKKNLKDADGKVDFLQASGVRSGYHGLLFEKATLTGPYAKMKDRGDYLEAGLKNLTVEGVGIAPRIGLLSQRLAGLEEKAKVAKPEDKAKLDAEITTLRSKITELQGLAQARVAAYLKLEAAKTPDEIEAAKEAVAESDTAIVLGLAQYGATRLELDDFGVRVTGAGDVLSDMLGSGLDVDRILKRGARIRGTGPDHRVLRRFALTGANAKDDKSDSGLTGSGNFELGETKLDVRVKRVGDSVVIDLDQFSIASLAMSKLLLTEDQKGIGAQIESAGSSSIEGVTLTGKLRMDKRPHVQGEGKFPADFRVAHVDITDFRINTVRADGLAYRTIPDRIEVSIKSGSIEGIWAQGISIDFPEKGEISVLGSAGIEAISDVEIAGAVTNGLRLEQGKINGSGLQVAFLKEGEIAATVGDLSATAMSIRGPDGWARFSLHHLSGAVNYKDGVFTVKELKLGSFEVPGIDWHAGKKHLKADKIAKVVDVHISGKVTTRKEPPSPGEKKEDGSPAEPKTVISSVTVADFHIGSIIADHLVYEDGEHRIEVGVADKDLPEEMKGFKPLYIGDFTIKDLEWDEKKGLIGKNMNVDIKTFEASAVYENVKDKVKAGFALKGTDMGATFIGANFVVASTGIIEKTGGFYKGNGFDTTFKTGQIFTSFTIGDDFVSMNGLEVDKVVFGHTTYTSAEGNKVEMQTAGIGHISVGKIQADLEVGKDDKGKDVKKVKQITADEIVLTDIHADTFTYTGKSVSLDDDKNEVVKDTMIGGRKAWIDRFRISGVTHDVAKKLTTLTMKIDSRNAGRPAFGIDQLTANIVKHVGTKETVTNIAGDLEGGTLTGENISFQAIPLGKVLGKDGKTYEAVTRTAIGGQFQLTRLGLRDPVITLTDEKKRVTKISTYASVGGAGGHIVVSNIKPRLYPNGTMVIPIESIRGNRLLIEKGPMKVQVPVIELRNFAAALKGMGTDEGLKLMAAKAQELSVTDLHMSMTIDRSKPGSDSDEPTPPGPKFFAEPVGEMTGELEVEPQLHHWYTWDPNVVMPIHNGKLNFENVHPYAVNLRKGEITLGNYKKIEIDVKSIPELPGMHPEQGKYGVIDFREMIEGIINKPKPPKNPNAKAEEPADLSGLNDLQVGGHLKLGKGKIGVDTNKSGTADEGDFFAELDDENADDNMAKIPWSTVGTDVEVNIKRLRAKRLAIPGGKDFPAGQTGEATLTGIKINVTGLAKMEFEINVHVKEGKIVNIEFGDISILDTDPKGDHPKVQAEKAPDLKAVNPQGEEGTP